MLRGERMKRRLSILFMFLFIFSILIPSQISKGEEMGVTVKATFGVDGVYKSYREMPITLEVENLSTDIQGELEVIYPLEDGRGIEISQELSLAAGDKKTVVLSIPVWESLDKIVVKINEKDNKIFEQEFLLGSSRRLAMNKLFVGTLSEDPESLSYLNSLKIAQGQSASKVTGIGMTQSSGMEYESTVANIPQDFLKENSKILDVFDVIIIDNYDTSKLSKGQITSLKQWVEKGKVLIVGTGVYGNKTLGMFKDDYIKLNLQELKSSNGYQVLPISIDTGEKVIDDSEYFQKIVKGSGNIVISSYGLGSEPFKSQIGKESMTSVFTSTINTSMIEANLQNSDMDYRIQTMVGNVVDVKLPNTKVLLLILVIYALIVGPGAFLIFKKIKKSSLLWIAIPIIAVGFTIVISLIGGTTRLRNPIENIKNFILVDSEGKGKLNSVVGIMFPYKSDLSIEEPENSRLDNLLSREGYMQSDKDLFKKNIAQKISYIGGKRVYENKDMSPFSPAYFSLSGEVKSIGKLEGNLYFREGKLEGAVKNTLDFDLQTSYLVSASGIYALGDIAKGQSINLSEINTKYKNFGDFNNAVNYFNGVLTEDQMEERMKKNIEYSEMEYFSNKYLGIYGANTSINKNYVVGYIDGEMAEKLNIGKDKVDRKEKTLVAMPVELSFENNGIIEYPFGIIVPELNPKSTIHGFDNYYGYIYENGEAYLDYKIEGNVKADTLYFQQDTSNNNNGMTFEKLSKFEVYNYNTSKYDEVNVDLGKIELPAASYLTDNKVMVKITVNNAGKNPVAVPQIAIKGRAK